MATLANENYVVEWCEKYGLDSDTTEALRNIGATTAVGLFSLPSAKVNDLKIPPSQKALLRGSLLQYKEHDLKVALEKAKKTDPHRARELANILSGQTHHSGWYYFFLENYFFFWYLADTITPDGTHSLNSFK